MHEPSWIHFSQYSLSVLFRPYLYTESSLFHLQINYLKQVLQPCQTWLLQMINPTIWGIRDRTITKILTGMAYWSDQHKVHFYSSTGFAIRSLVCKAAMKENFQKFTKPYPNFPLFWGPLGMPPSRAIYSTIIFPAILSGRAAWLSHRKHMSPILSTKACPSRHL